MISCFAFWEFETFLFCFFDQIDLITSLFREISGGCGLGSLICLITSFFRKIFMKVFDDYLCFSDVCFKL